MADQTADVRVKLSAEGMAEVVNAFKRIKDEAARTSKQSQGGFANLTSSLGGLQGILASIGVAVSIGAFKSFIENSIGAAVAVGRFSQAAGASVENFSALTVAAKENDVEVSKLAQSLGLFAAKSEEAVHGGAEVTKTLRAIGVSDKEIGQFKSLDTVERFALVAGKFSKLADGPAKTALAMDLLGKKGAALIPLVNSLGEEGLDKLRERAADLGILLSTDTVQALDKLDDNMKVLGAQATGLGQQFAGGMAPAVNQAITAISNSLKGGGKTWQEFGQIVGFVIKVVVGIVTTAVENLVTGATNLANLIGGIVSAMKKAIRGDFAGAGKELQDRVDLIVRTTKNQATKMVDLWKDLFTKPAAEADKATKKASADLSEVYRKRREALEAAIQAEIALVRSGAQTRQREEDRAFERGLVGVRAHYAARRDIVNQATNAEIAAILRLAEEQAKVAGDAEKEGAVRAKAAGQVAVLNQQRADQLAEIDDQELKGIREVNRARLDIENRTLEAQGKQHAARMAQIAEEARALAENIGKDDTQGVGTQVRQIAALKGALEAQAAFQERIRQFNVENADLGLERARIEDQVAAGVISQEEGTRRLADAERERLTVLRELAQAALAAAIATKDPEAIQQAQALVDQVNALGLALHNVAAEGNRLKEAFASGLVGVLDTFLGSTLLKVRSVGEAMRELARSVINLAFQIASRLLALKIVGFLFPGVKLPGFAEGGFTGQVHGIGGPTGDKNIIAVSDKEFVVQARSVMQPGVLSHLMDVNQYGAAALRHHGIRGFAGGGLVSSVEPAASTFSGTLGVSLSDDLAGSVLKVMESPAGQRLQVRVAQKNRRAMRA